MEAALNQNFIKDYAQSRKDIYDELKGRVSTVILNSMKGYLRQKEVAFDGSSVDLEEFKKSVVQKLDKQTQMQLTNIENELNKELGTVITSLKDGSQTAFSKFANKFGKFTKSTVEMVARGTAIKTAAALSPTLGTAVLGTSIIAPVAIKTVKDIRENKEESTTAALDVLLLKLCSKENEDKKEFFVSKEIMDLVANNLEEQQIMVNKNDSLMFLRDITKLDNKKKQQVVKTINSLKGSPYDVEKTIQETKMNLSKIKSILGKDVIAPISTAALYGMTLGTTLTQIAPDAVPSIISALAVGGVTGNVLAAGGVGGVQFALSKLGGSIPIVGNIIENAMEKINDTETLAASTGVAVAGVIAAKVVPGLVYKGAKGIINKVKNKKMAQEAREELTEEIVSKAIQDANEEMDARSDTSAIIDIVKDTLLQRGIQVPQNIKSPDELKVYLKRLDTEDKKQVYKIADILEQVKEDSNKSFKKSLKNIAKTAYWGGVIALAGLGMYDAFINPGFIDTLAEKNKVERQVEALNKENEQKEMKEVGEKAETKSARDIKEARDRANAGETEKVTVRDIVNKQVAEANKTYETQVEEFRKYLPKTEDEAKLTWKFPFEPAQTPDDAEKMRGLLEEMHMVRRDGIINKDLLTNVLEKATQNKDCLRELQNELGVKTVEEMVNSPSVQYYFRQLGQYQLPSGLEKQMVDYIKDTMLNPSNGARGASYNCFSDVLNNYFQENLVDIPTQSSSIAEITRYLKQLEKDPLKQNALESYFLMNGKNTGDFEGFAEAITNMFNSKPRKEILPKTQEIREIAQKATESKEEVIKALESPIPSDPKVIAGIGATAGTIIGTAKEVSKGIVSKIKSMIRNISPFKQKSLPPGQEEIKEDTYKKRARPELEKLKVKPENLTPKEGTIVKNNEKTKERQI